MVRNISLIVLLMFTVSLTFAQDLQIEETLINPSEQINDGQIELNVSGGIPPYTYEWSNDETPLSSAKSSDLTEGITHTVKVTDANGNFAEKSFEIKAESIVESFNGTFKPIVNSMGSVLFWDPFAAVGIYDPVVYTKEKLLFAPRWEPNTQNKFLLKQWLVQEEETVKKGQDIAIIEVDGESEIVKAPANGKIEHLA